MFYDIDLLSNGKIKNYPKFIPMGIIKIYHYKELKNASQFDDETFEIVVSSVLNSMVDWTRVKEINTVDQLTPNDRLKLLYFQIINSKGGEFQYTWTCPDDGQQNIKKVDVKDLEEIKLKKEINDIEYTSDNGIKLIISIPRMSDTMRLDLKIKEYREKVFEKIKVYTEDYLKIYNRLEEINKKVNFLKITSNPEVTNDEEIGKLKVEAEELVKKLEEIFKNEELNDKVKKILEEHNMVFENLIFIKSYKNLYFKESTSDDLTIYPYIKNNEMELEEYFKFIGSIDLKFLKLVSDFIEDSQHEFNDNIELECSKCHKKGKIKMNISPIFFFVTGD